jgi:hypothetical protein
VTRRQVCALAVILATLTVTHAVPADAQEPDRLAEAGTAMTRIATYVQALEVAQVEQAVDELGQQVAAYVAAVIPPPRLPVPAVRPGGVNVGTSAPPGGGGCYDGPIPAYIVTRESGGNPGAVNASSGAYGCFQIMPAVWANACGDLSRDVAGQIACANRISNGGTNLNPWR